MNEKEKMQRLHQLVVKGETLSAEEKAALQNWYETLDREENSVLNASQPISNSTALSDFLAETAKQVAKISSEVENLIEQNKKLRNENQSLRKTLETRLSEKVA